MSTTPEEADLGTAYLSQSLDVPTTSEIRLRHHSTSSGNSSHSGSYNSGDFHNHGDSHSHNGSGNASQHGPEDGSQHGSEDGSQDDSQHGSHEGSQNGSRSGSQRGSQNGSRNGSQRGSQNGSHRGSQNGSQNGSEDGSEDGSKDDSKDGSHSGSHTGSSHNTSNDANNPSLQVQPVDPVRTSSDTLTPGQRNSVVLSDLAPGQRNSLAPSENLSPGKRNSFALPATKHLGDDLALPIRPWVDSRTICTSSSNRDSFCTVNTGSLHFMKRDVRPMEGMSKRMMWSKHKWILLFSNTLLFLYSLAGLLVAILTFFKLYFYADTFLVSEPLLINLITAASVMSLFTSLIGYTGLMLNSRAVLTIYNLLLWPCFSMIASVGYVSYRKQKWNLEGKLSYQWHYILGSNGRAIVQTNLHCCGYKQFSDLPARSSKCFPRTLLPSCKFKYQNFTHDLLTTCYTGAFAVVPAHILVILLALLCSNHVNRQFGKGLPPKIYRLECQGIVAMDATPSTFNLPGLALRFAKRGDRSPTLVDMEKLN